MKSCLGWFLYVLDRGQGHYKKTTVKPRFTYDIPTINKLCIVLNFEVALFRLKSSVTKL